MSIGRYHVTLSEVWKVVVDVYAESEQEAIRKALEVKAESLPRVFYSLLPGAEVEVNDGV